MVDQLDKKRPHTLIPVGKLFDAIEAFVGLLIEITFIATLIPCFFGK